MNTLDDTFGTLLPDARKLMGTILKAATELFTEHGELTPVLFAVDEKGHANMADVPVMDDQTKPAIWEATRQLRQAYPIVAFVSEVWMAKCDKKDFNENGSVKVMLRDRDDKTEQAMVNLWQGERTVSFMADIKRNPNRLEPWEVMFDSDFPKDMVSLGGEMMKGKPFPLKGN